MLSFALKSNKENSAISPAFGTSKFFAFYDGNKLEILENPSKGPKTINWLIEKGVDTVIIKDIGKKGFEKIKEANIKTFYSGDERMIIPELLEKFNANTLELFDDEKMLELLEKADS